MTRQTLVIRLPNDILRRLRTRVALQHRDAFVQRLLEQALPPIQKKDALYRAALLVEQNEALNAEMAEWDGLAGTQPSEP